MVLHSDYGIHSSRSETSLLTYRLAVSPYSVISMAMGSHTDTLGSVPTQWRPLSLINTIVMSPAYCCTHHSRVSDLWPRQPAGLSVFSYALCLLFFYSLYLWETQLEEVSKPEKLLTNDKLSWRWMTRHVLGLNGWTRQEGYSCLCICWAVWT